MNFEETITFVASHDDFTMDDVVCYDNKHNEENGEGNRHACADKLTKVELRFRKCDGQSHFENLSRPMLPCKLKSNSKVAVLDLLKFEEECIPGAFRVDVAHLRKSPHITFQMVATSLSILLRETVR